jgi:hypothetical protein
MKALLSVVLLLTFGVCAIMARDVKYSITKKNGRNVYYYLPSDASPERIQEVRRRALIKYGVIEDENTPEDFYKLLEKAIAGDAKSQYLVAAAYSKTVLNSDLAWPFLKKDVIKAVAWLELSSRNGHVINRGNTNVKILLNVWLPEVTGKEIIEVIELPKLGHVIG